MSNNYPYKKVCPKCGFQADDGAIFCPKCGESLQHVVPVIPGARPTEPPSKPEPVPAPQPTRRSGRKGWIIAACLIVLVAAIAVALLTYPEILGRKTAESSESSQVQEVSAVSAESVAEESSVEPAVSEVSEEAVPEEPAPVAEEESPAEESEQPDTRTTEEEKAIAQAAYEEAFPLAGSYPLETPRINTLKVNKNGIITMKWDAVDGAELYHLFRYNIVDDKGWEIIGEFSAEEASFDDESAVFYGEYYYGLRAVDPASGEYLSDIKITHEIMPRPAPAGLQAEVVGDNIEITWEPVERCARYRVYRKTTDDWDAIGETTINHFTDTSVEAGQVYTYTVRCLSSSGKTVVSGYDETGITIAME